jgi:two-component system sensor kinase FixL
MIQVEIKDCGTGIHPEKISTLFEPFQSSKRDGLGLGLSISRSIIEAHRGQIYAKNNPDRGATFYFSLPVHEDELKLTTPVSATGESQKNIRSMRKVEPPA